MQLFFLVILSLLITAPAEAKISAHHGAGSVIIGPDDAPCDSSRRGAIRYESVNDYHEYCDGVEWRRFVAASGTGDLSTPAADTGYFVLSASTWVDNLGGRVGTNTRCLSDLTDNNWLNKDDAVARGLLIGSKVRGFICTGNTDISCNNALPLTTYTFAVSGLPTTGGAQFVTDSMGRGPHNTQNWGGTNYFGSDAFYWANRGAVSPDLWSTAGAVEGAGTCNGYSSSSTGSQGQTGNANNTGETRWNATPLNCSSAHHLICMVHP